MSETMHRSSASVTRAGRAPNSSNATELCERCGKPTPRKRSVFVEETDLGERVETVTYYLCERCVIPQSAEAVFWGDLK
jgi:hypothetical protein